MNDKNYPPSVSDEERWIVKNNVDSIRVEYRQTGTDTAATYVHLSAGKNKVVWKDTTFNKVARLLLGHNTCVVPNHGVRERVQERERWEKDDVPPLSVAGRFRVRG